MIQFLPCVADQDSASPPLVGDVGAAAAELNLLLLRCSELGKEVARIRKLLLRLAKNAESHRLGGRLRTGRVSARPSSSPDHRRRPIARSTLCGLAASAGSTRPVRSELARACRIALMEISEAASVETIYDRIERRGSFAFAGYKRPLWAIRLAMSAMVKRGEASLLNEAGSRRWRWEAEQARVEPPTSLTLT